MKVLDSLKDELEARMGGDPPHDFEHVVRVYRNAQKICKTEKANQKLVLCRAIA